MLATSLSLSALRRRATAAASAPPWWTTAEHLVDGTAPALAADLARDRYALGADKSFADLFTLSSGSKRVVDAAGLLATAAANAPAWDWSTGRRRLLLEPAPATNLCLQSNALATSAWTVTGTVSSDVFVGWSGATDLDRYAEAASANLVRTAAAIPIVAGQTYTVSCVLRRDNADWVRLMVGDDSTFPRVGRVWFNLATGTVGATVTGGGAHTVSGPRCTALGNGLWRCSFQVVTVGYSTLWLAMNTASASGSNSRADVGSGAGIGTAFGLGHVQVEAGAVATSWIPTTTAAATRVADDLRLAPAALALLGGSAATIALRGRAAAIGTSAPILLGSDAEIRLAEITSTGLLASGNGSASLTATTGGGAVTADFGAAIARAATGRKAALTGGTVVADAAGWGATPTALRLGATPTTAAGPLWLDAVEIWQAGASDAALRSQARIWS